MDPKNGFNGGDDDGEFPVTTKEQPVSNIYAPLPVYPYPQMQFEGWAYQHHYLMPDAPLGGAHDATGHSVQGNLVENQLAQGYHAQPGQHHDNQFQPDNAQAGHLQGKTAQDNLAQGNLTLPQGNLPQGDLSQGDRLQRKLAQRKQRKDSNNQNNRTVNCQVCGKTCKPGLNVIRHMQTVHFGTECRWHGCGESFGEEKELYEHLKEHQSDATTLVNGDILKCRWVGCTRQLKDKAELHRHLKIHNSSAKPRNQA